MTFKNLTCSWVAAMRTVGIRNVTCKIADNRITCILQAHGRIVWPVLCSNSILEASSLKSHVPVLYTSFQIRTPFCRCCRVDIINYLLYWFHQFASLISLYILRYKAVACNHLLACHLLLVIAELIELLGKISHSWVEGSKLHWFFWQQHKRSVHLQCHITCCLTSRKFCQCLGSKGSHRNHLGIYRKSVDIVDIRQVFLVVGNTQS